MDIIVGIVFGAVIGYLMGRHKGDKKLDDLRLELCVVQEQLSTVRKLYVPEIKGKFDETD